MSYLHHVKIIKYQRFNLYLRNIQHITNSLIKKSALCSAHGTAPQRVMFLQTSSTKNKFFEKNKVVTRKEGNESVSKRSIKKNKCFSPEKNERFQISYQTCKRFFYEKSLIFIPIHLISTSLWFALFYIFCDGGIGCVALKGTDQFKSYFEQHKWGKLAAVILLMKLVAPLRYAVSIGLTIYLSKLLSRVKIIKKAVHKKKET